jgi:mRNA-degrading endonuclease RelE of RelBE toxin-antitoxin system
MRFKYEPVPDFIHQFVKLTQKDRSLKQRTIKKIDQILTDPEIGEPKKYKLKMARGVHVNPFVIVYMIVGDKIIFLWFDHHDRAYEKACLVLEKIALRYPHLLVNDRSPERIGNDDDDD